jgi:hypothetical protein
MCSEQLQPPGGFGKVAAPETRAADDNSGDLVREVTETQTG